MAEEKALVHFMCQRCSSPIKLDDTLNSFSEHITAELSLPIISSPDVDLETQLTSFDHYVRPCGLSDSENGANGFMLISDKKDMELSHNYKVKAALYDKISGTSNIDHPLCEECTDFLIELLEQEIKDAQSDYDDYMKYYEKLQKEVHKPKLNELMKELEDLEAEENRFLSELEALKSEEIELQENIAHHREALKQFTSEEEKYMRQYTKHRREWIQADEEAKSLECQYNYAKTLLKKLQEMDVYKATFHIWYQDHFGTINNFRLGRLPSSPVDWSEINAAWGQTALLLDALARKIDLQFEKYKLVPFGNHSYIEVIGETKQYPLYGTGSFKFLLDTKFDTAMIYFLECLQQFQSKVEQLEEGNKSFCFPYRINRGKIEDKETYSIKIQLNSQEHWTKALKFMLTNLKWGLTWISSQLDKDVNRGTEE